MYGGCRVTTAFWNEAEEMNMSDSRFKVINVEPPSDGFIRVVYTPVDGTTGSKAQAFADNLAPCFLACEESEGSFTFDPDGRIVFFDDAGRTT